MSITLDIFNTYILGTGSIFWNIYFRTNYRKWSPSKANNNAGIQESLHLLSNLKSIFHAHKSPYPNESSPHPHTWMQEDPFKYVLSYNLCLSKQSLSLRFYNQNSVCISCVSHTYYIPPTLLFHFQVQIFTWSPSSQFSNYILSLIWHTSIQNKGKIITSVTHFNHYDSRQQTGRQKIWKWM